MNTIAERVAAGAAFLDEREPGWDRHIDLDELNISDSCGCVLGQLHGTYREGLDWYADELLDRPDYTADIRHGFMWDSRRDIDDDVQDLTAEWKRVITGRRP